VHYFTSGGIGRQKIRYPQSIGHECSGTIEEIGPGVHGLSKGQRVAIDPAMACGECDQCLSGRANTCRGLQFMGCPGQAPGTLAEYAALPATNCFPIPDSMSLVQAAVAEPLSIGIYAAGLAPMKPGAKAGVLGTGPIGLSVLMGLSGSEAVSYATDLLEERLAVARQVGAAWTGRPVARDVVSEILALEPEGLDVVFECAGTQETLDQGIELLKPGGTLVMVGITEGLRVSFDADLLRRKELRLQNVRRQNGCTEEAVRMIAEGRAKADLMVTHRFPLEKTQDAFETVAERRQGAIKAVIEVD
jgi:L-iditol 2-dehydrogenase